MVRRSRRLELAALLACWSLTAAGCGLIHRWWGEDPPEAAVVSQPSSSSCPNFNLIFTAANDESSRYTFDCWKRKSEEIWTQIRPARSGELTEAELEALVRRGVIPMQGSREDNVRQLIALKRLFGVQGSLSRQELSDWMKWLGQNRLNLRALRTKFYADPGQYISYADLKLAAGTLSDFLHRVRWNKTSDEIGHEVSPLLSRGYLYLQKSAIPMARVLINSASTVCPTLGGGDSPDKTWDSAALGECLEKAVKHFEPGAPWFEFILNPSYADYSAEKVTSALDALKPKVDEWFSQPGLSASNMLLWVELGKSLGLGVDEKSLDSIQWVHQFNEASTSTSVHPTFVIPLFDIIRESQKRVLEGLPFYAHCDFTQASAWKTCTPDISPEFRKKAPLLDYALQIRNINYGASAVPLNRSVFQRIMFFDAAAKKIIAALDDKAKGGPSGVITVGSFDEPSELLKLLDVGFQFQENTEFAEKLKARLSDHVPIPGEDQFFLRKYNRDGITKLVALIGDTLFHRRKYDITVDASAEPAPVFPLFKKTLVLDSPSLAAVLSTLDFLADFRRAYIESDDDHLGVPIVVANTFSGGVIVSRRAVMKALPDILKSIYPRIYQSCVKQGYAHSCAIVYDRLIPGDEDNDLLHLSDLDIITITSIFAESILDSCDGNFDQKLSSDFFDGNDELDCGFKKLKDTAERLMDAGVIQASPSARSALRFVNAFFLTRPLGKIALARGTRKNIFLHYVPGLLTRQEATLGSMMSLAAEIIDEQKFDDARQSDEQLRLEWEAKAKQPEK